MIRDASVDPAKQGAVSRVFSIMREISQENRQRKENRPSRMAATGFSGNGPYHDMGGFAA